MSKAEMEVAPDSSSMESPTYFKDATELATLIRTRQVSSREAVQAHLDRIAAINPKINAIVTLLAEDALKGADAADNAVAAGKALGPFHGVPFTINKGTRDRRDVPSVTFVDRSTRTGSSLTGTY